LNAFSTHSVDLILQLGDVIDGRNATLKASRSAMANIMQHMESTSVPVLHCIGNHELYNFSRFELVDVLPLPTAAVPYISPYHKDSAYAYSVKHSNLVPESPVLFIVLDTYEISVLGYDGVEANGLASKAKEHLLSNRRKIGGSSADEDWNSPHICSGVEQRFCAFNGALSDSQVNWLDDMLTTADKHGWKAIISGHQPIHPDSGDTACLAWNYVDVLNVLTKHQSAVAYFSGHCHEGGYKVDSAGIHHITMQGGVEAPPGSDCFGVVRVFYDRLELSGEGCVPSRTCFFRSL